jgi:hypothetical protein
MAYSEVWFNTLRLAARRLIVILLVMYFRNKKPGAWLIIRTIRHKHDGVSLTLERPGDVVDMRHIATVFGTREPRGDDADSHKGFPDSEVRPSIKSNISSALKKGVL